MSVKLTVKLHQLIDKSNLVQNIAFEDRWPSVCYIFNKQLFLNEMVFRFRKDIGSPRRPGVVIYSP